MNLKAREWARLQPWFRCSDSRSIWSKDKDGNIERWFNVKALREWDQNVYNKECTK